MRAFPALVVGASGQVGEHLLRALHLAGQEALGTGCGHLRPGLRPLDLRDPEAVAAALQEIGPRTIYLPAAMTDVDYCERCPREANAINVAGTRVLAEAAGRIGAALVFFSSDYVFDGSSGPYAEGDPPNPICEYGRQKLAGERAVTEGVVDHLIVRTTVVYGWEAQGKNFVVRLADRLRRKERIRVPKDQIGSPTYAPNLAEAVVELVASGARGIFHVAGPDLASRYEFAVAAARAFGLDPSWIEPVWTHELAQAAQRPLKAGLRVDKALGALRRTRLLGFREALGLMARRSAS